MLRSLYVINCPLKHPSVELINFLFGQMYEYAIANDLADKNYSDFITIRQQEDDESGVPFSETELKTLWDNRDDEIIEMVLIMCYSGYRISAYKTISVNLEDKYFQGILNTPLS